MVVYEGFQLTGLITWSAHTVIIGTVVALPLIIGLSLLTATTPSVGGSGQLTLRDEHRRVLRLLGQGYTQMVEITDFLTLDTAHGNRLIEELVGEGLAQRQARQGPHFFTLALTARGRQQLGDGAQSGEADSLALEDPIGLQVLEHIQSSPRTLRALGAHLGVQASPLGAVVSRLDRLGYLHNTGIWERRISLSQIGQTVLAASCGEQTAAASSPE
jgi:DNA-binding MarR family transcriptional regulator